MRERVCKRKKGANAERFTAIEMIRFIMTERTNSNGIQPDVRSSAVFSKYSQTAQFNGLWADEKHRNRVEKSLWPNIISNDSSRTFIESIENWIELIILSAKTSFNHFLDRFGFDSTKMLFIFS